MSAIVKVEVGCGGKAPSMAHEGDAGYDLFASEGARIEPMKWRLVHTGVRLSVPPGMEAQVRSRSGNALRRGVFVMNSPGTIDSGYRGEVGVILFNASDRPVEVEGGDRIAQLVFCQLPQVRLEEGEVDGGTDRGAAGFGSTGTVGGR